MPDPSNTDSVADCRKAAQPQIDRLHGIVWDSGCIDALTAVESQMLSHWESILWHLSRIEFFEGGRRDNV